MAHILIQMNRGNGWEIRAEGDMDVTLDQVRESLPAYAIQYPHRAFVNGELIGEAQPKKTRLGNKNH
jgi:hypothetical protein